jgi:hypothetical protein
MRLNAEAVQGGMQTNLEFKHEYMSILLAFTGIELYENLKIMKSGVDRKTILEICWDL